MYPVLFPIQSRPKTNFDELCALYFVSIKSSYQTLFHWVLCTIFCSNQIMPSNQSTKGFMIHLPQIQRRLIRFGAAQRLEMWGKRWRWWWKTTLRCTESTTQCGIRCAKPRKKRNWTCCFRRTSRSRSAIKFRNSSVERWLILQHTSFSIYSHSH